MVLSQKFRDRAEPEGRSPDSGFDIQGVSKSITLGTAGNQVRLVPLGSNPHVSEMLGVWAVDRNLFFVSDIHVPRGDVDAPVSERALSECWFASWAVKNLPPDTQVVNSHSPEITTMPRFARYLESSPCREEPP